MRIPASQIPCILWNVNLNTNFIFISLIYERCLMCIQMLLSCKVAMAVFLGWFVCCTCQNRNMWWLCVCVIYKCGQVPHTATQWTVDWTTLFWIENIQKYYEIYSVLLPGCLVTVEVVENFLDGIHIHIPSFLLLIRRHKFLNLSMICLKF
jgi:hypothetical protein